MCVSLLPICIVLHRIVLYLLNNQEQKLLVFMFLIIPFQLKRGFVFVSFMSPTWQINYTIQYNTIDYKILTIFFYNFIVPIRHIINTVYK